MNGRLVSEHHSLWRKVIRGTWWIVLLLLKLQCSAVICHLIFAVKIAPSSAVITIAKLDTYLISDWSERSLRLLTKWSSPASEPVMIEKARQPYLLSKDNMTRHWCPMEGAICMIMDSAVGWNDKKEVFSIHFKSSG